MRLSPISSPAVNPPVAPVSGQVARADTEPLAIAVKSVPVAPAAPLAVTDNISPAQRAADNARLDKAVEVLNRYLKPVASSIQFSVDEQSGRTLVKVIDTDTMDVLRQFPSKEALAISESLDKFQGLLIREKA